MTTEPERGDETYYEVDVRPRMRLRTWVALGALGAEAALLISGVYLYAALTILAYVLWMFVRDALRRRSEARSWVRAGGSIGRGRNW
jgi:hypothetical protein